MDRREVVARVLERRGDALVVTGLGGPAWDVAAAGDHRRNFYLWGAMGGAAMLGLGLALARPAARVLVITGDGEQLMALGGLATVAVQRPANYALLVLDNESYGETGGQATHTRFAADLAAIASAAGIERSETVCEADGLTALIPRLYEAPGPLFAAVKVARGEHAVVYPPRDGVLIKQRFRAALAP